MKFIYVVVIVISVFVQSLFCNYDHQQTGASPVDRDGSSVDPKFENELSQQFFRKKIDIADLWSDCKLILLVPFRVAMDIFQNPPLDDDVRRQTKCFVDCILSESGVMSDSGFDETKYMTLIRQLRYNYTSFDIHKKSSDAQQRIMDIISKRANKLPSYIASDIHDSPIRNSGNELIESYKLAAQNCKHLRASDGDRCETSWMIVRCIMRDNRKRFFNSPFYPIRLGVLLQH